MINYQEYLIIILLIIGILFDYLSVFYKTAVNNNITGKLLSSASLTQFYSRIFYLSATFIVVFLREQYNIYLDFFYLIFTAVIISLLIIIVSIKYINILKIIFFFPNWIIEKIHNFRFNIYNKTTFKLKIDRVIIFSFIINILIFSALISPFVIIRYFPNLSMSSVYSSQAINFISNLLLLTFYDPRVNNLIDNKDMGLRGQILAGKFFSYLVLITIYIAL
uniref:hypothetical protein n=1 Tax=Polynucleobacter sp. TaxID=2029855 RepID=UPI00404716A3